MERCVAGCKHYHGGEILHHEDCPFYPDSMSKEYRENKEKLRNYEERLKKINTLFDRLLL